MHPRTIATLKKLEQVDWFRNVGVKDLELATIVSSWQEAMRHCESLEWENLRLDAANTLGIRVRRVSVERYNAWNEYAAEIRPVIEPLIDDKSRHVVIRNGLPRKFTNAVRWDIGHLCMECEYADIVPPAFFTGLAYWYVAGHFPCGWEGDYPEGRIIVF